MIFIASTANPHKKRGKPNVKRARGCDVMRQFLNKRKPSLRPILKDFGVRICPPRVAGLIPCHKAATYNPTRFNNDQLYHVE